MAKIYPKGIFFNKPSANSPEFVRGRLSIKVADAVQFLNEHVNAQGYVNLDMLNGEKGIYLALNEWKKPESMTDTKPVQKSQPDAVSDLTEEEKQAIKALRENAILKQKETEIKADEAYKSW